MDKDLESIQEPRNLLTISPDERSSQAMAQALEN